QALLSRAESKTALCIQPPSQSSITDQRTRGRRISLPIRGALRFEETTLAPSAGLTGTRTHCRKSPSCARASIKAPQPLLLRRPQSLLPSSSNRRLPQAQPARQKKQRPAMLRSARASLRALRERRLSTAAPIFLQPIFATSKSLRQARP